MNSARFDSSVATALGSIEKHIKEIVADCERRQQGAEQRLEHCRKGLMTLGKACDDAVYRLLTMKNDIEAFERLPLQWQKEIKSMIATLQDTQRKLREARNKEGW